MKKKPLLLIAITLFWIGYLAISFIQHFNTVSTLVEEDNFRRLKIVDFHLYVASPMLAEGKYKAVLQDLDEAKSAKEFDFYILRKNDEVMGAFNPGQASGIIERLKFPLGFFKTEDNEYLGKSIQVGDFTLSMGVNMRGSGYVLKNIGFFKWDLIQDLLLVTGFFGLLLFLVLKDILDLARFLSGKDRTKAETIKVRSKEAATLLAVASQFERVNEGLKLTNQTYADSMSPAIRYELNQETPEATAFPAIVVRVDVNGYTYMFLEKKDQFVTQTLNRYFKLASEMIGRYGGHIYQFVGDEIVFHFKEMDYPDAQARAVSCVRSLFEVARQVNDGLKEQGVPFVVKASMARGRLRFVQLDTGFAFAGLPLIESVRMLGKIEEREDNMLALYAEDFKTVTEYAHEFKRVNVAFKGFSYQTEIVEVKDFTPASKLLPDFAKLELFKSDSDLVEILDYVRLNYSCMKREDFFAAYKVLKDSNVQKVGGTVSAAFVKLIAEIDAWSMARPDDELRILALASVTSLAGSILKSGAIPEPMREVMEKNLEHRDQRVRGNSVLALDELSPESYSFKEMFSLPFNRAAADALIAEGRRDYTEEMHRVLKDFLKSKDPFFVASGLFVLTYLYNFHRHRDSVYFKANSCLLEVPGLVAFHLRSKDNMVRRRAQISRVQLDEQKAA